MIKIRKIVLEGYFDSYGPYHMSQNLRSSNIVDISGALFILRIQHTQTQCDEGARDVNNIWVPERDSQWLKYDSFCLRSISYGPYHMAHMIWVYFYGLLNLPPKWLKLDCEYFKLKRFWTRVLGTGHCPEDRFSWDGPCPGRLRTRTSEFEFW